MKTTSRLLLQLLLFWVSLFSSGLATADSAFSGVAEIDHPEAYTQVLALSDVHGMADALITLLTHAGVVDSTLHWKAGKTLLLVVGDSIDKGPKSIEVLDLWVALSAQAQAAGGKVVHLLGNHEAEFLAYGKKDNKSGELFAELKQKDIRVKELRAGDNDRSRFLRSMPVAAKVGRWVFCHSGLYPEMSWKDFAARATAALRAGDYENALLLGDDSVLEAKDWWLKHKHRKAFEARMDAMGVYGVVQGHQPKAYGIKNQVGGVDGGKLIKLDTGMAPVGGSHAGELLRFAKPAEMNESKTPHLETIDSMGKVHALEIQ